MTHKQTKIDETVLATLLLTLYEENRAWKGHFFEVLDRLHEKGYNRIEKIKEQKCPLYLK